MTVEPENRRASRTGTMVYLALIFLAAGGLFLYWVDYSYWNPPIETVPVFEENCSIAYISPNMPNAGSICAVQTKPVEMPMSFNLSSPNTLHEVYFGVFLQSGHAIKVSMNSNAPLRLYVYLDNRTGYDAMALANEVAQYSHLITNQTGIASYSERLLAQESSLYIFELTVSQPNPVPNVSFNIQPNDLPP